MTTKMQDGKKKNAMHVLIYVCDTWKDWLVNNLKTKNFPVDSFEEKSSHFRLVKGDLRSVKTVKNFKTLKSRNFMQKNNLKSNF